ncbi:cytochrome P450 [Neolentinus lepideus HHB14362 ss-1]|uniref:Cytochrome P450 n=1 Tax=Neolentinus lepideus HHB14362 ss-1 TaxID=1314782 RepID=A0A165VTV5_9AGAM|nr:cytochrome P450 [Neolentinus lepideus HHB14362 ss-1]
MTLTSIQWGLISAIVLLALYRLRHLFIRGPLHNIAGPPSASLFTGNLKQLFDSNGWAFHRSLLEQYGSVARVTDFLGAPRLFVSDPLALYHIVIKDLPVYDEFPHHYKLCYLLFGDGLFAAEGEEHRKQRKMLNPVFSAKHLREIVPIFLDVTYELRAVISNKIKSGVEEIDMLDWMKRTALELIGRAGLGHSFDVMQDGSIDEYGSSIKSLFPILYDFAMFLAAIPHLMKIGSPSFRRFVVESSPSRGIRQIKEKVDVMEKTSKHIYQQKLAALHQGDEVLAKQIGGGKDIMSLLLKENLMASEEDRLSVSQVLGQMSTLIFAAMDTTSSALSRILCILATNPEAQNKLRKEVREAHALAEFSYDTLDKLPYLEAICRETLRLHPPNAMIHRRSTQDSVLPLSMPVRGRDGSTITKIPVPGGTPVTVSLLSLNRNKVLWGDDAYEWKPERWLKPLPAAITDSKIPGVYSNIMTFWGGPRGCIGFKFSLLEMKVVLAVLVESFRFELTQDIAWDMGIITVPRPASAPADNKSPFLPMKVSLAEDEDKCIV